MEKKEIIANASNSISGGLEVEEDGTVVMVPAAIMAAETSDEVIHIVMEDGTEYNVHTLRETMPVFEITGKGVDEANTGVYDLLVDGFLLRISTDGELVYYD